MNAAQLGRFDRFFDENFATIVDDVGLNDPSEGVLRTRAGFASAYRFWSKVEDDGDPVAWVCRVIAEDRRAARGRSVGRPVDASGHRPSVDLRSERLRVVALARRQRAVARVVIGTSALLAVGGELFVVHR
jgi:hypothetical protein